MQNDKETKCKGCEAGKAKRLSNGKNPVLYHTKFIGDAEYWDSFCTKSDSAESTSSLEEVSEPVRSPIKWKDRDDRYTECETCGYTGVTWAHPEYHASKTPVSEETHLDKTMSLADNQAAMAQKYPEEAQKENKWTCSSCKQPYSKDHWPTNCPSESPTWEEELVTTAKDMFPNSDGVPRIYQKAIALYIFRVEKIIRKVESAASTQGALVGFAQGKKIGSASTLASVREIAERTMTNRYEDQENSENINELVDSRNQGLSDFLSALSTIEKQ